MIYSLSRNKEENIGHIWKKIRNVDEIKPIKFSCSEYIHKGLNFQFVSEASIDIVLDLSESSTSESIKIKDFESMIMNNS
jgi:hypothetical protein